jgi:hypothetical protein
MPRLRRCVAENAVAVVAVGRKEERKNKEEEERGDFCFG